MIIMVYIFIYLLDWNSNFAYGNHFILFKKITLIENIQVSSNLRDTVDTAILQEIKKY